MAAEKDEGSLNESKNVANGVKVIIEVTASIQKKFVNEKAPFEDRCNAIINGWQSFSLLDIKDFQHQFSHIDFIYSWSLRLVLQDEWNAVPSIVKTRCKNTLEQCKKFPVLLPLVQRILPLVDEPWGHPILKSILGGSSISDDDALHFLNEETWQVLRLRVDTMIDSQVSQLLEVAFRILRVCMRCIELQSEGCNVKECPDDDKEHFTNLYYLLLFRYKRNEFVELVKNMETSPGLSLVRRYLDMTETTKIWKHRLKMLDLTCALVLAKCIVNPNEMQFWSVFADWCDVQRQLNLADAGIAETVRKYLAKYDVASCHLYVMASVLLKKIGFQLFPLVTELLITALSRDLNTLEVLKIDEGLQVQEVNLQVGLANGFMELAEVFSGQVWLSRECVLTAFSLHPTQERLEMLQKFVSHQHHCQSSVSAAGFKGHTALSPKFEGHPILLCNCIPSEDNNTGSCNKRDCGPIATDGHENLFQPSVTTDTGQENESVVGIETNEALSHKGAKTSESVDKLVDVELEGTKQGQCKSCIQMESLNLDHKNELKVFTSDLTVNSSSKLNDMKQEGSEGGDNGRLETFYSATARVLDQLYQKGSGTCVMCFLAANHTDVLTQLPELLEMDGVNLATEEVVTDLGVVLSRARWQVLSWYSVDNWDQLLFYCEQYLVDPEGTRVAVKELKNLNVDYDRFKHMPSAVVTEFTGIEKGYERFILHEDAEDDDTDEDDEEDTKYSGSHHRARRRSNEKHFTKKPNGRRYRRTSSCSSSGGRQPKSRAGNHAGVKSDNYTSGYSTDDQNSLSSDDGTDSDFEPFNNRSSVHPAPKLVPSYRGLSTHPRGSQIKQVTAISNKDRTKRLCLESGSDRVWRNRGRPSCLRSTSGQMRVQYPWKAQQQRMPSVVVHPERARIVPPSSNSVTVTPVPYRKVPLHGLNHSSGSKPPIPECVIKLKDGRVMPFNHSILAKYGCSSNWTDKFKRTTTPNLESLFKQGTTVTMKKVPDLAFRQEHVIDMLMQGGDKGESMRGSIDGHYQQVIALPVTHISPNGPLEENDVTQGFNNARYFNKRKSDDTGGPSGAPPDEEGGAGCKDEPNEDDSSEAGNFHSGAAMVTQQGTILPSESGSAQLSPGSNTGGMSETQHPFRAATVVGSASSPDSASRGSPTEALRGTNGPHSLMGGGEQSWEVGSGSDSLLEEGNISISGDSGIQSHHSDTALSFVNTVASQPGEVRAGATSMLESLLRDRTVPVHSNTAGAVMRTVSVSTSSPASDMEGGGNGLVATSPGVAENMGSMHHQVLVPGSLVQVQEADGSTGLGILQPGGRILRATSSSVRQLNNSASVSTQNPGGRQLNVVHSVRILQSNRPLMHTYVMPSGQRVALQGLSPQAGHGRPQFVAVNPTATSELSGGPTTHSGVVVPNRFSTNATVQRVITGRTGVPGSLIIKAVRPQGFVGGDSSAMEEGLGAKLHLHQQQPCVGEGSVNSSVEGATLTTGEGLGERLSHLLKTSVISSNSGVTQTMGTQTAEMCSANIQLVSQAGQVRGSSGVTLVSSSLQVGDSSQPSPVVISIPMSTENVVSSETLEQLREFESVLDKVSNKSSKESTETELVPETFSRLTSGVSSEESMIAAQLLSMAHETPVVTSSANYVYTVPTSTAVYESTGTRLAEGTYITIPSSTQAGTYYLVNSAGTGGNHSLVALQQQPVTAPQPPASPALSSTSSHSSSVTSSPSGASNKNVQPTTPAKLTKVVIATSTSPSSSSVAKAKSPPPTPKTSPKTPTAVSKPQVEESDETRAKIQAILDQYRQDLANTPQPQPAPRNRKNCPPPKGDSKSPKKKSQGKKVDGSASGASPAGATSESNTLPTSVTNDSTVGNSVVHFSPTNRTVQQGTIVTVEDGKSDTNKSVNTSTSATQMMQNVVVSSVKVDVSGTATLVQSLAGSRVVQLIHHGGGKLTAIATRQPVAKVKGAAVAVMGGVQGGTVVPPNVTIQGRINMSDVMESHIASLLTVENSSVSTAQGTAQTILNKILQQQQVIVQTSASGQQVIHQFASAGKPAMTKTGVIQQLNVTNEQLLALTSGGRLQVGLLSQKAVTPTNTTASFTLVPASPQTPHSLASFSPHIVEHTLNNSPLTQSPVDEHPSSPTYHLGEESDSSEAAPGSQSEGLGGPLPPFFTLTKPFMVHQAQPGRTFSPSDEHFLESDRGPHSSSPTDVSSPNSVASLGGANVRPQNKQRGLVAFRQVGGGKVYAQSAPPSLDGSPESSGLVIRMVSQTAETRSNSIDSLKSELSGEEVQIPPSPATLNKQMQSAYTMDGGALSPSVSQQCHSASYPSPGPTQGQEMTFAGMTSHEEEFVTAQMSPSRALMATGMSLPTLTSVASDMYLQEDGGGLTLMVDSGGHGQPGLDAGGRSLNSPALSDLGVTEPLLTWSPRSANELMVQSPSLTEALARGSMAMNHGDDDSLDDTAGDFPGLFAMDGDRTMDDDSMTSAEDVVQRTLVSASHQLLSDRGAIDAVTTSGSVLYGASREHEFAESVGSTVDFDAQWKYSENREFDTTVQSVEASLDVGDDESQKVACEMKSVSSSVGSQGRKSGGSLTSALGEGRSRRSAGKIARSEIKVERNFVSVKVETKESDGPERKVNDRKRSFESKKLQSEMAMTTAAVIDNGHVLIGTDSSGGQRPKRSRFQRRSGALLPDTVSEITRAVGNKCVKTEGNGTFNEAESNLSVKKQELTEEDENIKRMTRGRKRRSEGDILIEDARNTRATLASGGRRRSEIDVMRPEEVDLNHHHPSVVGGDGGGLITRVLRGRHISGASDTSSNYSVDRGLPFSHDSPNMAATSRQRWRRHSRDSSASSHDGSPMSLHGSPISSGGVGGSRRASPRDRSKKQNCACCVVGSGGQQVKAGTGSPVVTNVRRTPSTRSTRGASAAVP